MPAPAVGSVVNGYTYLGGNPNDPGNWREASVGESSRDRARGTALGKESGKFAADSIDMTPSANAMIAEAENVMKAVDTYGTGTFGGLQLGYDRTGFIGSNDKRASALGGIELASSSKALEAAQDMKGALSDKDIAFLKSMSYGLGKSSAENRDVARLAQWAGMKAKGYQAARSAWESKLGTADTRNARGQTFADWWGSYSEQRYPRPNFGAGERGSYRAQAVTPQQKAAAKPAAKPSLDSIFGQ